MVKVMRPLLTAVIGLLVVLVLLPLAFPVWIASGFGEDVMRILYDVMIVLLGTVVFLYFCSLMGYRK